jgi:RNA polymerase sigma factor (sigma-70 family)
MGGKTFMAGSQWGTLLQAIRRLVEAPAPGRDSDAQLLELFARDRDESAFATLMQRHAPLVWGVCCRLLHDIHDIEDAFQATFLVLARKAGSIRNRDALGTWLYSVAYKVAARARAESSQRHRRERQESSMPLHDHRPHPEPADRETCSEAERQELRRLLDDELSRLPEKYRAPLVLCYLEGKSGDEAAEQLHWPKGTVSGRLARARDLLRQRLTRRGLALSAAAVSTGLSQAEAAALPAALQQSTLEAALRFSTGSAAAAGVSARAAFLATGVMQTMMLARLKMVAVILIVIAGLGSAGFWVVLPRTTTAAVPVPEAEELAARLRNGEVVRFPNAVQEYNAVIAVSPNRKYLATAGDNAQVQLWDLKSGKELPAIQTPFKKGVAALAFSPDSKRLIAACSYSYDDEGQRKLAASYVDLATGKETRRLVFPFRARVREDKELRHLRISLNGKLVAALVGKPRANEDGDFWGTFVSVVSLESGQEHRLEGMDVAAFSLCFSPDGRSLAAAGDKGTAVWDLASGKKTVVGGGFADGAAFSPDGQRLCEVFAHGSSSFGQVWDLTTGKALTKFDCGDATNHAFSPDGGTLLTVAQAFHTEKQLPLRKLTRWDAVSGEKLGELIAHEPYLIASDGRTVVSADGKDVVVWDLEAVAKAVPVPEAAEKVFAKLRNGEVVRFRHPTDLYCAAISPNRKLLASAGKDETVRVWEVGSGKELTRITTRFKKGINALAFTPDSKGLVVACAFDPEKPTNLAGSYIDLATSKEIRPLTFTLFGPGRENMEVMRVQISPGGKYVGAVVSKPRRHAETKEVWGPFASVVNLETGKALQLDDLHLAAHSLCFSPDGKSVAAATIKGIRIWELPEGKKPRVIGENYGDIAVFSPDGKRLCEIYAHGSGGRGYVWDVQTGDRQINFEVGDDGEPLFSPDGGILLTLAPASKTYKKLPLRKITRWNAPTGDKRGELIALGPKSIASDNRTIVSLDKDDVVLWDLEAHPKKAAAPPAIPKGALIALSPDGKLKAVAVDRTVTVLNGDGEEVTTTKNHKGKVTALVFSPDGKLIASGSDEDKSVRVWSTFTGGESRVWTVGGVVSIGFSGDGRLISVRESDKQTRAWNLVTGKEVPEK